MKEGTSNVPFLRVSHSVYGNLSLKSEKQTVLEVTIRLLSRYGIRVFLCIYVYVFYNVYLSPLNLWRTLIGTKGVPQLPGVNFSEQGFSEIYNSNTNKNKNCVGLSSF